MSMTRNWFVLAVTVVTGYLLYLLAPILTPFAIAALLAYLGDPIADKLVQWKCSRTGAVLIVFLIMTGALVIFLAITIPVLEREISTFIERLPHYVTWFRDTAAPWLIQKLGIPSDQLTGESIVAMLKDHWQAAGGVAARVLGSLSNSGAAVLSAIMNVVLIPVVTFYLLRDWDRMIENIKAMLPREFEPVFSKLAEESDTVLGAFMRGQITVMAVLGAIYSLGLWAVGLEFSFLIGMGAGLVSFVPYLGAILGLGVAIVAVMVQFGDLIHLALVLMVFGIGQTLESFWLTPKLVGDKIGLHPVAVIFAIMAGGQLFGFLGVLLALPVASVVMVLLRHFHDVYRHSDLYDDQVEIHTVKS